MRDSSCLWGNFPLHNMNSYDEHMLKNLTHETNVFCAYGFFFIIVIFKYLTVFPKTCRKAYFNLLYRCMFLSTI